MRFAGTLPLLAIAALTAGCEAERTELRLVRPDSRIDGEIVTDIVNLLGSDAEIQLAISDTPMSDEAAIDALLADGADLALVSNSIPYRRGISTVMSLYPTVLHVGYVGHKDFETPEALFDGARIFAGSEGSASRMMFDNFAAHLHLDPDRFQYVNGDPGTGLGADVFVVFAPIAPDRLAQFQALYPDIRLLGRGSPQDIGSGAAIDATTLLNPHLRPFVIPVGTYGTATPEPVLTVAVDMLLVARSDLSASVIYDLVQEMDRLRPALASLRPGLFQLLEREIGNANSTFVLHPGLIAYRDRNEPTVYERYSGVAEVVVTLMVALFSAGFAVVRIFRRRRKNRIDVFYTDVIEIRNGISQASTDNERIAAGSAIRQLKDKAFEMLVAEKLSADESFRIFISLCNDALREIEGRLPAAE